MLEILNVDDVAKLLKMEKFQVYRYTREGVLPAVRIGRALRFSRVAIDEWIKRGGTPCK